MKQTKVLGIILGLFLLTIVSRPAMALPLLQKNINLQLIPSNIPTPTGEPNSCNGTCGSNYNCKGDYFCYQGFCRNPDCPNDKSCVCAVNPTLTSTKTPTPKISLTPTEEIPSPTESSTATATITAQPTVVAQSGNNLTFWFLVATIGLLAVIIIVQAWPRKNGEE
jgi:hypothetical protein